MSKKIVSSGSAYNVTEVQNAETILNKTTTLSSSSTDTEYASAKATYDAIQAGGATDLNAVHYTADTAKTEEQKTQARTNIGAGTYSKPDGGIPSTDLAESYLPLTAGSTKSLTDTLFIQKNSTQTSNTVLDIGATEDGNYRTQLRTNESSGYGQWNTLGTTYSTWGNRIIPALQWGGPSYNYVVLGEDSTNEIKIEAKSLINIYGYSNAPIQLKSKYILAGDAWTSTILYPGAPDGSTTYKSYLGCDSSIDASKGNHYWICTYTDAIKMKINDTRQDLATYLGTKEDASNKVTAITSSSTDTQYPSAKLVYDATQTLQTEINNLKSIGRFLAILDASNGTVSSQPSGSVGDSYSYKVGDYYRVGTAGTYAPKSTATYIIDETSGSSNFEQGTVSYGIGDLIYCSNLTETTSTWVKQQSSGGGTVQDVQVNGTSILSGGVANITSGNLPSHTHTLANITDVSATATEVNYLFGTTSNVQTQLDAKGTYSKPDEGIPSTDMTSAVQTSLGLADTAVQPVALNSYLPLTAGSTKALTGPIYEYRAPAVNTWAQLLHFGRTSSSTLGDLILRSTISTGSPTPYRYQLCIPKSDENNPYWFIFDADVKDSGTYDYSLLNLGTDGSNIFHYTKLSARAQLKLQASDVNSGTINMEAINYELAGRFRQYLYPTTDLYVDIGKTNYRVRNEYVETLYTTINGTTNTNLNTYIVGKEDTSNKVTSISASSTDIEYPSAKLLYDQLATKQSTLTVNPATTSANLTSIGINGTNYALAGGTQVIWRTY